MRADARRNHARLLEAARDVFVEQGPGASLEEVARRAEVGIATLYRRFTDRHTLMHAVALHALTGTIEAVRRAQRDHPDPLDALAAYVHAVLDLRTSVVIPTLLAALDLDEPELKAAQSTSARLVEELLAEAHKTGGLRDDVVFGDIGLLLTRLSRPLPGPFSDETQNALAHRHADIILAGLRASTEPPLAGPALKLADLQQLRHTPDAVSTGTSATSS
ncbi:TetR/AcrR family transcriptional regulator [Rugosimonospora africana]|uniref:TetR family transcriptional regulator n=1 Tax=Rugosimonospora africana TaxID=556532 RepID=A0A8J3R1K1_9ACTN|nr:TetR/AcrR family transcriptional regulator [Rugosimonospora africana]GIH19928.1 TetR family transcriptional regulator [Rugosimonospora africana]